MSKWMPYRQIAAALLLPALAAAGGCGERKPAATATPVAAVVNSDRIEVQQVEEILAGSPKTGPEAAARHRREALDKLIDLQLARQQAVRHGLDRSAGVVQALEAAKTEILARAYLAQVAVAPSRLSLEEVSRFYAAHPELFSERRVYDLEEISIERSAAGLAAALRERAAKGRSIQELADWLQQGRVEHAVKRGARAAEQIPLELLAALRAMTDGDLRIVETATGGLVVLRMSGSQLAPVAEAVAAPRIQQFHANRRSGEAVANAMKRLREGAEIEYVGEFARPVRTAGGGANDAQRPN
jgi:EpsD family peptidyl-prolyl cis-trans isomerase